MSGECEICFEEYDTSGRLPKVTACGHTFCLECLQKAASICPKCRKTLHTNPKDMITNYSVMSRDSSSHSKKQYCEYCKKIAVTKCQLQEHPVQNLKLSLRNKIQHPLAALKSYEGVLENVTPYILSMQDTSRDLLNEVMAEGDKCKMLSEHLRSYAEGEMVDKLDSTVYQAQELTERKCLLERGLQLGSVRKGTLTIQMQCRGSGDGNEASHIAKLDIQALAAESPHILAAAQMLMHLLSKHGHLQSRQESLLTARDARGKTSSPTVPKQKPRSCVQDHIPKQGIQNASSRSSSEASSNVQSAVEITTDGVLDLGPPNSIGASPFGEHRNAKEALLRNSRMVRELKGLECAADPDFSKRLITKHLFFLESVDLRKVQSEHFNLLSSMPQIKNLKIVGYDGRLADFPPQPAGRALKSLYVHLPLKVELSMWKAFASSLQTVTLRIEVDGVLNVHLAIKPCADASPKLNSLQLHRKDPNKHTQEDCDKQIGRVRQVVKDSVLVTCNICRHQL